MNILTADEIKSLMECEQSPCVSIFMPTHRRGKEIEQDPIRLKNLLKRAEGLLQDKGVRSNESLKMLKPAAALLENGPFWRHQSDGLAIFLNGSEFHQYRLPMDFDELVVVTDRYHIKPLLSMLSGDGRFYILAFSQKRARLLQASRYSVGEVDMEGMPPSLSEWFDPDNYQQQLQFHTGVPPRPGRLEGGKREPVYHGAGSSDVDRKEIVFKYFQQLDRSISDFLKKEQSPLVMAGVDYLFPIYKDASKYPFLVDKHISGNPDEASMEDLHRRGWEIVEPVFRQGEEKARQRLEELLATKNVQASAKVEDIVAASAHGRVDTLFVVRHKYCWGNYDPSSGKVELHKREQIGGQDLLDFSAINTLSHSGTVYAVGADQFSDGSPMAAIFRY
jgi:hypothetical protein